ncbi:Transcription cofactor vestigial-like protein 4 [Eumeta japonica]|uniref:Transcription cofactor vestigial-like protein 4 n=1 Tax=Eumeta variegata TaxID=151549 RepID=A0A4C1TLQ6_EUMVA|nr:Transcription cofactor vestigial-like protein 4 [Eumeta japonica]
MMELRQCLLLLSTHSSFYHPAAYHMEPPHSPKFNLPLWQPWVSSTSRIVGTPSGESEGDRTVSPDAGAGAALEAEARELTGKWRRERRDRRDRRLPDYRPRENGKMALRSQSFNEKRPAPAAGARGAQPHSDGELSDGVDETHAARDLKSNRSDHSKGRNPNGEAPIDMRLTRPAPPPYPGATRPSVITRGGDTPPDSVSMCDPVIDEHFRRSLGDNYMSLFKKNEVQPGPKPNTKDRASSPILFNKFADPPRPTKIIAMDVDDASLSVDDHFTKALGDTWRQIQTSRLKATDDKRRDAHRGGVDDHFSKALGDTWNKIKTTRHNMDAEPADDKPTKEQTTKIISRSGVVI